ncbi:MAG: hypothetical protein ACYC4L_10305 [Chloroflexota bacterium]
MVNPRWLECDTCQNCRREGEERQCLALGLALREPPIVECEHWRELPDLPEEVQSLLARRYSGLY